MARVAVINTSTDLVEILTESLEHEGYEVDAGLVRDFRTGKQSIDEWFARHRPDVVIFDVAIPYDENWRYFEKVRAAHPELTFVVTTTNRAALELLVGATAAYEIVGKPYDLDRLLEAIRAARR